MRPDKNGRKVNSLMEIRNKNGICGGRDRKRHHYAVSIFSVCRWLFVVSKGSWLVGVILWLLLVKLKHSGCKLEVTTDPRLCFELARPRAVITNPFVKYDINLEITRLTYLITYFESQRTFSSSTSNRGQTAAAYRTY